MSVSDRSPIVSGPRPARRDGLIATAWVCLLLIAGGGPTTYLWWANHLPSLPPDQRVIPRLNGFDACLTAISKLTFMGKTDPRKAKLLQNVRFFRGAMALTSLKTDWYTGSTGLAFGRGIHGDLAAGALAGRRVRLTLLQSD